MLNRFASALIIAVASVTSTLAQSPSGKVTVVTSFSKDLTDPFKKAFEKVTPGVTLDVQSRNTTAGVKYLEETRAKPQADLFWASAPDAFEVLKAKGLLQIHKPSTEGIPEKIGAYPINDPQGFYFGFAASGYGIMWNTRYVEANRLPVPKEWADLARPEFFDHVSIAAPSRSGTTHLTIETILQGEGWEKGWRTLKEMSGNMRQISDRSFGVPDAVNSGQIGYGVVIDFFAFAAEAAGFPVKFVYPSVTTIVPANVGIVANAPNPDAAKAFVAFLLSPAGQELLLDPKVRRLPVNPAIYAKAPKDYPNPFTNPALGANVTFDSQLSSKRSAVVSALFDQIVTFELEGLKAATKAIHVAEAAYAKKNDTKAHALLQEARSLIAAIPFSDAEAASDDIAAAFTPTADKKPSVRQAELERNWAAFAKERHLSAKAKADEALKLVK